MVVRGKYRIQMEIFACYRVAIYCAVWNNQIYCDVVECVSIMRENTMQTLRLALIFTQYTHSWCATCSLSFTYIHHWYVDIYIFECCAGVIGACSRQPTADSNVFDIQVCIIKNQDGKRKWSDDVCKRNRFFFMFRGDYINGVYLCERQWYWSAKNRY